MENIANRMTLPTAKSIAISIAKSIAINGIDLSGSTKPLYPGDLYPPTNPVCGQPAHGGRHLQFKGELIAYDQIGTRLGEQSLQPDRCIVNDGIGGGVVLDTSLVLDKWAYGRFINQNSVFEYNDGVNTYRYENGILTSTIPGADPRTITTLYITQGNNYIHVIYDLTGKTEQEIADYMGVNACLFNTWAMPEDAAFPFRRYLLNSKSGSTAFDSGSVTPKINGIMVYDDITESFDGLHNTTLYPENLLNASNKEGYSKAAYFNGVDCNIEYSNTINVTVLDVFEIEIVFMHHSISNYQAIVSGDNAARLQSWENRLEIISTVNQTTKIDDRLNENTLYFLKIYSLGDGYLRFNLNGYDKYVLFDSTNIYSFSKLGRWDTDQNRVFNGYIYRFKGSKNGITLIDDPLNGSTIGTPTNVDFNKIVIPQDKATGLDIFGRELLYKNSAKYNSAVVGGTVAVFDGHGGYIEIQEQNVNMEVTGNFIELKDFIYQDVLTASNLLEGTNEISLISIRNSLTDFRTTNSFVRFAYRFTENKHYKSIKFITNNGNLELYVDDVFVESKPVTGIFQINSIGGHRYTTRYLYGLLGKVNLNNQAIYPLNGHAINSIDGVEAINNGVTFKEVVETPQSTIDSLSKTVYDRGYGGELVINGDFSDGDNGWNVGTDWVVTDKAYCNGLLNNNDLFKYGVGGTHLSLLEFDIEDFTPVSGGTIYPFVSLDSFLTVNVITANGHYKIVTHSVNGRFSVRSKGCYAFSIDNITVKEVIEPSIKIIDPQFPALPTDIVRKGKGYKQVGAIDFDPEYHEPDPEFLNNVLEDPSFIDATKWNVAGSWVIDEVAGVATRPPTVGTTDNLDPVVNPAAVVGKFYRVKYIGENLRVTYGGIDFTDKEIGEASSIDGLLIVEVDSAVKAECSLVLVQEVVWHNNHSIGHLAFSIFNLNSTENNTLGLPKIYSDAIIPMIDYSNVFKHRAELIQFLLDNPNEILEAYRAHIYSHYKQLCGETLTDIVVYPEKRNIIEHVTLLNRKWCPNYGLSYPLEVHPDWELVNGVSPSPTLFNSETKVLSNTRNIADAEEFAFMNIAFGLINDIDMQCVILYEGNTGDYATYVLAKGLDMENFIGVTSYNGKIMLYERHGGTWHNLNVEIPVTGTAGKRLRLKTIGNRAALYVADVDSPIDDGLVGTAEYLAPQDGYVGFLLREHPQFGDMIKDWKAAEFIPPPVFEILVTSLNEPHFSSTGGTITVDDNGDGTYLLWSPHDIVSFNLYANSEATKVNVRKGATIINMNSFLRSNDKLIEFTWDGDCNATNLMKAFEGCGSLLSFPMMDTSKVTNVLEAWKNCYALTSFPPLDLSSVTNLNHVWENCYVLTSFPSIILGSNNYLMSTWKNCYSLIHIDPIDYSSIIDFSEAWNGCSKLTCIAGTLDGSNSDSFNDVEDAFKDCSQLIQPPPTGTSIRSGDDMIAGGVWTNPDPCPDTTRCIDSVGGEDGSDFDLDKPLILDCKLFKI